MTLEFKQNHNCTPPKMSREISEPYTKGFWLFKREAYRPATIWDTRDARWDCPVCKARWRYMPSSDGHDYGWWLCQYRPEVWEKE